MYNELLSFILLFVVYLIPQAMFINGVWLAASGSTEIRPDGSHHDSEMIFYPLKKYLEQKRMEKVYFNGDRYIEIVSKAKSFSQFITAYVVVGDLYKLTDDQQELWINNKAGLEVFLDAKINITTTGILYLYREFSVYRFSKYLRKPIFGCIICMSSFWGLITFLLPALIIFKDPIVIALYVPNTFCLSYLNYKIFKPL